MGDSNHVLLIDHDPIGLFQERLQIGMRVGHPFRIVEPFDVSLHHAGLGNTGTDDGAGRHQRQIAVAAQLAQELAHGWGFDVEAADRVACTNVALHLGIGFERLHIVHIDGDAPVLQNDLRSLPDMAEAALREDVELGKADFLSHIHIEMGDRMPHRHRGRAVW